VVRGDPQSDAEWLARQITEAFPWDTAPKYLIRDNDRAFGVAVKARVRAMGIRDRPTSYRSPWQNGYVERLIGSIRHECTDHLLVFNVEHLRRILSKIDAEARRPLTSRQFDIECPDFTKNVAHAHCVNASAQQSPQHSRSGPHPTRYLKGLGELLLAQADALRPSAADD
jgi:hypothetical protein